MTGTLEMRAAVRWKMPLAIAALLLLLLGLVYSGQWPALSGKLSSSSKGLLANAPSEIERIGILRTPIVARPK